jgi:hypothetical protein
MFRKILASLGIGAAQAPAQPQAPRYAPYRSDACNFIYNLLFCDNLEMFRNGHGDDRDGPWVALLADQPDAAALRAIAANAGEETRVRVLAFNRLREIGQPTAEKTLLGTIVEVPLPGGLDVLAVFDDGRIRYINQTEKMAIYEATPPEFAAPVQALLARSGSVVGQIGPWDRARLPPPAQGKVRLTFLVADGLYFGEGEMAVMQREAMAGPVIAAAQELLVAIVQQSTQPQPAA